MYDVFEDQVSLYVQQTSVVDGVLFLPGIYILRAPQTGVVGSVGIGDLNLVSNWSLPTNASLDCHLKTDGIHNSFACAGTYASETLVEFGQSNFSLNGEASFIITWYNNGSLVGSWSTDEGDNQICGLGKSFEYSYQNFALHNQSLYILAQSPQEPACSVLTLQDGTNLSCSPLSRNGQTGGRCYYFLQIGLNGSVVDGIYSRGDSDGYPQNFAFRTPISFQLGFTGGTGSTVIRNLDGTVRQMISSTSGQFAFLENFSFIRSQRDNLCSGGRLYLKDVILHPNYTFYVAYTTTSMSNTLCSENPSSSGSSLPSQFLTWFGNDYQNLSRNNSYPVSIGFVDHVGNDDWVFSYYQAHQWMQYGIQNSVLSASNNSLFMHGWTNPSGNVWPLETFGKATIGGALPGINGMLFDMNGTWLEATPSRCTVGQHARGYAYDTWYACDESVGQNNLVNLHVVMIDSDQDNTPDFYDAFPVQSSQSVDSDLDGYGDAQNGYQADACVLVPGNSTEDVYGCVE